MVVIDNEKCLKCGLCVKDCFPDNLSMTEDGVLVKGNCMLCGHCVAICPANAVTIEEYPKDIDELKDLKLDINPDEFLNFVKARRSARHFLDRKIDREVLEKIIEVGRYSATSGNSQNVRYYVFQDKIEELKPMVWEGLINLAKAPGDNPILKMYAPRFIKMYENKESNDKLFLNAPTLIVITGTNKLDGALAVSKMELMANMLGVGVLYSGFIERAINCNPKLVEKFELDKRVTCTCLLLGYTDMKYQRTAPRKEAVVSWE